jgi:ribosome biogenesis GTPase
VSPRKRSDLDEDDVRVRPGKGKSRPRSKDRPGHTDAASAFVVAVDRGRYTCVITDDGSSGRKRRGRSTEPDLVTAMRARELGRKGIVVGDRVQVVGDLGGGPDTLARIVRIEPRTSILRRSADDTDEVERVIVANADQLVIVVALADPEPRIGLIDRALVAAYVGGLEPVLCLTKSDLATPDELLSAYAGLDLPVVVTRRGGDLAQVRARLADRLSVLVGHSGVGKSTLVNALVPDADRAVGVVNAVTGRGRHTSTSAAALELPEGAGWVVDTPGIRSFGLGHVDADLLFQAFADLAPGIERCPRGCTHDEPDCGLDAWVAEGHATRQRLDSLRRLLRSIAGTDAGGSTGADPDAPTG